MSYDWRVGDEVAIRDIEGVAGLGHITMPFSLETAVADVRLRGGTVVPVDFDELISHPAAAESEFRCGNCGETGRPVEMAAHQRSAWPMSYLNADRARDLHWRWIYEKWFYRLAAGDAGSGSAVGTCSHTTHWHDEIGCMAITEWWDGLDDEPITCHCAGWVANSEQGDRYSDLETAE